MGRNLKTIDGAVFYVDLLGFGALTKGQIPLTKLDFNVNANFNEKELHQSPFSKIKRDLVKEFGSAELKNLLRL